MRPLRLALELAARSHRPSPVARLLEYDVAPGRPALEPVSQHLVATSDLPTSLPAEQETCRRSNYSSQTFSHREITASNLLRATQANEHKGI
jgi:hypothetical protein